MRERERERESSGGLARKKEALLDFAHQKDQEKNDITLSWTKHPSIVKAESCISASFSYQFKGRRENMDLIVTVPS